MVDYPKYLLTNTYPVVLFIFYVRTTEYFDVTQHQF